MQRTIPLDEEAVAVLQERIREHGGVSWREAQATLRDAGLRIGSGRLSALIREATERGAP